MKRLAAILTVLCLFMTLCACKDDKPQETLKVGEWHVDLHHHWHENEDGKRADEAAHTLGDDRTCDVCKAQVTLSADGSGNVCVFAEDGTWVSAVYYDADGKVISTMRTETAYDANGNIISNNHFMDGRLSQEEKYAYASDGTTYACEVTVYDPEGSKEVTTYLEDETMTSLTRYDENGKRVLWEYYEVTYDADGNLIHDKTYRNGLAVLEHTYAPDAAGLYVMVEKIEYDEDGNATVTRYDTEGNVIEETKETAPEEWHTTITTVTTAVAITTAPTTAPTGGNAVTPPAATATTAKATNVGVTTTKAPSASGNTTTTAKATVPTTTTTAYQGGIVIDDVPSDVVIGD